MVINYTTTLLHYLHPACYKEIQKCFKNSGASIIL